MPSVTSTKVSVLLLLSIDSTPLEPTWEGGGEGAGRGGGWVRKGGRRASAGPAAAGRPQGRRLQQGRPAPPRHAAPHLVERVSDHLAHRVVVAGGDGRHVLGSGQGARAGARRISRCLERLASRQPAGPPPPQAPRATPRRPPARIPRTLMSLRPCTGLAFSLSLPTRYSAVLSMPRLTAIGLAPAVTHCRPKWIISRARHAAVVVPSPAASLVRPATCARGREGRGSEARRVREGHAAATLQASCGAWAGPGRTAPPPPPQAAAVKAGAHLLDQLRAGVLHGVGQLDRARDGHAVVDDLGHAKLLLQHDVAACGAAGGGWPVSSGSWHRARMRARALP
jgi:hypothetical protein